MRRHRGDCRKEKRFLGRSLPGGVGFIVACSLLFIVVPRMLTAGEETCRLPLSGTDVQTICDALAAAPRKSVAGTARVLEQRLADQLKTGLHRTLPGESGCYSLAGVELRLYAEEDEYVFVDSFRRVGDVSDTSNIKVLSCQVGQKGTGRQRFIDTSVQMFWQRQPADRLTLTVERSHVPVGQRTGITAHLWCGPCGMESEKISFRSSPATTLSPATAVTDHRGVARTSLTMNREESVQVVARYEKQTSQAIVEPVWRPWYVEVTANFSAQSQTYAGEAEFHGKSEGIHLGWIVDQALKGSRAGLFDGFPFAFLMMNENGADQVSGSLRGWEKWRNNDQWEKFDFDRQVAASLLVGLRFHQGRPELGRLYVDLSVEPIYLFTGTGGQYYFSFDCPLDCGSREDATRAALPFDVIRDGRSLTVEATSSADEICHWSYTYTFRLQRPGSPFTP